MRCTLLLGAGCCERVRVNNAGLYVNNSTFTTYPVDTPPTTSSGTAGDKKGMVSYSADYFYYCTDDYTTGGIQIWQRVVKDATAW